MFKMHVMVLKILGLAISMHTLAFPQDFPQLIFQLSGLFLPGLL